MKRLKSTLLLIIVLVAFDAHSQHYKKERLQLIEQHKQINSVCDSLCDAYNQQFGEALNMSSLDFTDNLIDLSFAASDLEKLKEKTLKKLHALDRLNRLPAGITRTTLDTVLTISSSLEKKLTKNSISNLREWCKRKDHDLNELGVKPRESDLDYLKNEISNLEVEKSGLEADIIELQQYRSNRELLMRTVPQELKLVQLRSGFVWNIHTQLENAYEAVRTEFAEKGPKGYSQVFFDEFPDVFNQKKEYDIPVTTKWVEPVKTPDASEYGLAEESPKLPPPPPPSYAEEPDIIYTYVDTPAEFPGGGAALKEYLAKNIVYPESARKAGIEGVCYVQFIVSAKGNISNVEVKRGVIYCPECDKEAKRVIEVMPQWKPGEIEGRPVNSTFSIPVRFKLSVPVDQK